MSPTAWILRNGLMMLKKVLMAQAHLLVKKVLLIPTCIELVDLVVSAMTFYNQNMLAIRQHMTTSEEHA